METVSIEDARRGLGELVERARMAAEPTMITRYGKAAAVIVNAEWYEQARAAIDAA